MNKLIYIFSIIIISNVVYAQALVDKVIAKVGSEYILLSEVEEEFTYAKSKDPALSTDVKCQIISHMIDNKLIVYHAKVDSVVITDEEVESQLTYRFESVLQQMNGDEAFFQEYYGATVDEMKERYRDDQKHKILADKMQYKLISDIEITPKEVEKFFTAIPTDSLPYFKSEIEISEIIIKPKVNDVESQKALTKATEIRDQIKEGKITFGAAATKFSQDPGSALREGDLGFAKRGVYVPEFEAAVFALANDEISEIIETQFGFHIIQMIERRGNTVRARHVLIKPEITSDDLAITKRKMDSIRTLVMNDSLTFEKAVKMFSDKDTPSFSNSGRVKNQSTNNTFFQADDLDPDTYFAVYDLKKNELAKSLEIQSPNGEKSYRLLQLNSLSKPHKANLKEDYNRLADFAKESKKSEYFVNWMKKKRAETYINIDPIFSNCSIH